MELFEFVQLLMNGIGIRMEVCNRLLIKYLDFPCITACSRQVLLKKRYLVKIKVCKQLKSIARTFLQLPFCNGVPAIGHLICNHISKWFEKSGLRKVVREIWFEKSGSRKVVDQKKRWFYTINPHFFRL